MALMCSVCKINHVKMPVAATCSLKCACDLNCDNYGFVLARLAHSVAKAKLQNARGSRAKA